MDDGDCSLGYFLFEVSDLDAWDRFLVHVVGAEKGESLGGSVFSYRIDDHVARILLRQGPADDLIALGFQVQSEQALADFRARAEHAGHSTNDASHADAQRRGVRSFVQISEPGGIEVDVFVDPVLAQKPFSREIVRHGFVTGQQGVGHLALRANDIDETKKFFENVLQFSLSDRIQCTLPGDFKVDITFLHVNQRHHTVALGSGLQKHLHHFMLQMASLDDVGSALDRAFENKVRVVQGLGRHPNDHMVSFYCVTPSGFECEIGWGGRTIDDTNWQPTTYDRISDWGHRSPYKKPPPRSTNTGERA